MNFSKFLNESKSAKKIFLVKFDRSLDDAFIDKWKETANNAVDIDDIEKYSDNILKVTLNKGSVAKLKSIWQVSAVQSASLNESTLNEASKKRISDDNFSKIGKIMFGMLSADSTTGRGSVMDLADVTRAKILIDKMPKKKLFTMLVAAGTELGLDLVPVDGSDATGFVKAGPGGEDCIMLKLKGNDYSSNDPDGDFNSDLVFALEQLTIGSGV